MFILLLLMGMKEDQYFFKEVLCLAFGRMHALVDKVLVDYNTTRIGVRYIKKVVIVSNCNICFNTVMVNIDITNAFSTIRSGIIIFSPDKACGRFCNENISQFSSC